MESNHANVKRLYSITAVKNGSVLSQDVQLIQKSQHFARELIPKRVVHPRGAGAHGNFVSNADFSHLIAFPSFSQKGKSSPAFVRFSIVIHSKGSPETLRDPRGLLPNFILKRIIGI